MPGVYLRQWRDEDVAAVATMIDDPHLIRWSSLPILGATRWIETQRLGARGPSLAICLSDDGRALGKIALRLPGHASAATSCAAIRVSDGPAGELSYWIVPFARGRGLAGAAVQAMLSRPESADLRSMVMDIENDNAPSIRVAERLGAERREPQRVVTDRTGILRTMVVFVLRAGQTPAHPAEPGGHAS